MAKFELNTLTSYDDESLIKEIRRVAEVIPEGKLSHAAFNRLSKVHSSTVFHRFGNWRKALAAAGIADRFDDTSEAFSKEEIIHQMKELAGKLGRAVVTKQELCDHTGISDRPIRRLFGSYRAALEAAGLSPSPLGRRYSDEECFENLLAVWTAHGRQPKYGEMKMDPSRVGPKAYILRWGNWRNALQAFVERVNRDNEESETEVVVSAVTNEPAPDSSPVSEQDRHEIKLGLRYRVLVRDRFRCVLCGASPATDLQCKLHVDHVIPWSKNGKTVMENLRTLCEHCNLGKGNRLDEIANR